MIEKSLEMFCHIFMILYYDFHISPPHPSQLYSQEKFVSYLVLTFIVMLCVKWSPTKSLDFWRNSLLSLSYALSLSSSIYFWPFSKNHVNQSRLFPMSCSRSLDRLPSTWHSFLLLPEKKIILLNCFWKIGFKKKKNRFDDRH
jgi:hypothetical protein